MSKIILKKRVHGFTIVSNNVIFVLKNNLEALGFYLYLLSLPDEWEFYKTVLAKECSIGIKKVDKLLRVLKDFGLVKYGQERNEKGRFERFFLEIYDVEQINEPKSPDGNFCRTVETVGRIGEAIKEEVIKKESFSLKNKYKSFYKDNEKNKKSVDKCKKIRAEKKKENEKKHDFAESMNKMAQEKKHIEENEKLKYAPMPSNLKTFIQSLK